MKKLYLFGILVFSYTMLFSQSTLVVIDRENIPSGSTLTGNAAGVSSIGFTRGSGIDYIASGLNHTSVEWGSSDQASAALANEYIEWSVSALPTFTAIINEIDIRLRRNSSGPANFQIFYSFDNFATAGTAATSVQVTPTTAANFNFNGLSITSPVGGTITFRIYAWNSSNSANGWLRIARNNGWNDLGISGAGARIIGSATSSSTNDRLSDIILEPTHVAPENIDYINFNAASGLTSANSVEIAEFTIRDITDSDSEPTILTDIEFQIINFEYLQALAIYDGTTLIAEVNSVSSITSFLNLNGGAGIIAPSGGTKSFQVYATFTSNVSDNEQFQLVINSALNPATGSSFFAFGDAGDGTGGAASSIAGDDNKIEVIIGELGYFQNPTNVNLFEPNPVILAAQDANANQDFDYDGLVSVSTTGTFDPVSTTSVNAVDGLAIFNNLVFSETGTNFILIGSYVPPGGGGSLFYNSTSFNVGNPLIILAQQDFDGSGPEWTFTNDIAFFDNGWGTDGYYGPINVSQASPLDWPFFSGNVIGDNDLNDEGENGTSGFARLTFDEIDISGLNNVKIIFDWQVIGYTANTCDVRYRTIIDGANGPLVTLFDGNGIPTEDEGRVVIQVPDGTTTVAFYIEVRNNQINGFSGVDNFRLVTDFDGLIFRNGSWIPSAPNELTGADDVLINSGNYTITSPIEVNDFIVSSGSSVDLNPGQTLLANGTLANYGTFNLNSTSTLYSSILPVQAENTGNVNYNRFVNIAGTSGANGGNDLISAPLLPDEGQGFDTFITLGNPSNASKLFTNGILYAFAPYNNSVLNFENFSVSGTNPIQRGVGYRVATTIGEPLTFSGDILTTDLIGVPVSRPVSGSQWNLIGNPYPSYISSLDFIAANTSVFDPAAVAVYGYHSGTNTGAPGTRDNYTIVNNVSNSSINIAPGQGFFIAVQNTPGFSDTVDFLASMRTLTGDNDFILSRNPNNDPVHLQLKMSRNNNEQFTDIYFHENATRGLDPGFDAAVFGGGAGNFGLYTHLVENNQGRDMAIQAVGINDLEDIIIPLGVNVGQGQQVTIGIKESNISDNIEILLEDQLNNSYTRLNSSDFTFTATSTLSNPGRFFLRFSNNSLSINEKDLSTLQIYANSQKEIVISGILNSGLQLEVYDIQGRLVLKNQLNSQEIQHKINAQHLANGVYIVRIADGNLQKSQKLVLN